LASHLFDEVRVFALENGMLSNGNRILHHGRGDQKKAAVNERREIHEKMTAPSPSMNPHVSPNPAILFVSFVTFVEEYSATEPGQPQKPPHPA
jgi:hypothetical protein